MNLQQLRDKRSKILFDAHAIMAGENVTAEQRTQVDTMLAEANILKADIERQTQLDAFQEEQRSSGTIPRGTPGGEGDGTADTRTFEERRTATGIALRKFMRFEAFDKRDLTVAADGAVTIPVGVTDPKIARKSAGSVYDLVGKLRTSTGEAIKVPYLNDTANGFVLNSVGASTTDPSITGITISIDDIRMNPILIENSLIQDVGFDIVAFVEAASQSRYTRTVSNWITGGNTSNVGALTAITAGITGLTAAVVKYVDFTNLIAALDPAYANGAVFTMSNATLGLVQNILDTNGRPIFLAFNDGGISGFAGQILGYPVKINPYQPAVATGNVAVQFGNFEEGYIFREVAPGIMLKRLNERYAELNKVGFVAFARVGGAVTDAGTHPIISLTIR